MVFNSLQFFIFFVIVYFLYRTLSHKYQNRMLLFASYFFYGCWDWRFLGLIVLSTVVDFFCGLNINKSEDPGRRKLFLIISICTNLGILGFFKYFNFFAESLQGLASVLNYQFDYTTLNIILPVGISFYTFQTMSYTIDIYRKEMKPTGNFLDFALFVAFFPQLVAGPIERAKKLLPQIINKRECSVEKSYEGLWLISWGLYKKVFIADNLARIVDEVFLNTGVMSGGVALMGVYAFAFQIYGDFSGYSDIARGLSKLMGIDLMINFRFPFFVTNPRDFWRNWHISLSTWLRDYLYIPLGGNRGGGFALYRNLLITMILGGLWHGASYTFVIWGTFHGLILLLHRLVEPYLKKLQFKNIVPRSIWFALRVFFMFQLTSLGWLIFRAESSVQIRYMLKSIIFNFSVDSALFKYYGLQIIFYTWLLLLMKLVKLLKDDMLIIYKMPLLLRWSLYTVIYLSIVLFGEFGVKQFIYFQF